MDTISALASRIGPRRPCSANERRGAEWCASTLDGWGYEVEIERFASRTDYQLWFATYTALAFLGAILVTVIPAFAVGLGVAGLALYVRDAEGHPARLAFGNQSQNVLARQPRSFHPEVVVMAHVDSASSSLSFHPALVRGLRGSVITLQVVMLLVIVLALSELFVTWDMLQRASQPASLVLATYLFVVTTILVHGQLFMPYVAGANDNASGVEVLMRLARSMDDPRVWFVVTGSEESGMVGAQSFLEEHDKKVRGAAILNIDSVGRGIVTAARSEGILRKRLADKEIFDLAVAAGAQPGEWRGLPTDATVAMARGYRALSLIALAERGLIPNWHWSTDVVEEIDPTTVDRATEIAQAVVDELLAKRAANGS